MDGFMSLTGSASRVETHHSDRRGGKLMSSDINELYRRVIYRNNTLTDLLTTSRSTPGELVMCQEKLVGTRSRGYTS
uniref:DNA-directed RNA polymerase n=1 Tax=Brassica campestris TaxID=3711 RepID=A0A3P6D6Z8_BRACM|nr:unnamed protein product [Brassica rapa]